MVNVAAQAIQIKCHHIDFNWLGVAINGRCNDFGDFFGYFMVEVVRKVAVAVA